MSNWLATDHRALLPLCQLPGTPLYSMDEVDAHEEKMVAQSQNGLNLSASAHFQKKRYRDCQSHGEQTRQPQRRRFGHSHDPVLHQPRWQEPLGVPASSIRKSKEDPSVKAKKNDVT